MTRNRFNQAKKASSSNISLSPSKAHQLFLEDNHNIDMKDTYKTTTVYILPIDEKDVLKKEYCDNNLLSSSVKIDFLNNNITELRKGDFDKVTTKTLQLSKTQVNEELIIEFNKSANKVTNSVNFCKKKVACDTISEFNQLKQKFDNNKLNQNITNIHLDDIFTTGLKEFNGINKKTNSNVDEALLKNKKTIVQYIKAILLESKLVGNKEQAILDMHYDFSHEDILKEIESYFTI